MVQLGAHRGVGVPQSPTELAAGVSNRYSRHRPFAMERELETGGSPPKHLQSSKIAFVSWTCTPIIEGEVIADISISCGRDIAAHWDVVFD